MRIIVYFYVDGEKFSVDKDSLCRKCDSLIKKFSLRGASGEWPPQDEDDSHDIGLRTDLSCYTKKSFVLLCSALRDISAEINAPIDCGYYNLDKEFGEPLLTISKESRESHFQEIPPILGIRG